jgi:hypothetical protein
MKNIYKIWCKQEMFAEYKISVEQCTLKYKQKNDVSCGYFTISYISDYINNRLVESKFVNVI